MSASLKIAFPDLDNHFRVIGTEGNVVTAIIEDKFAAAIMMMAARISSYTERGLNQVVL